MYGVILNSKEDLYKYVTSDQVFKYFFKEDYEVDTYYNSPYPDRNDSTPSFRIDWYKDDLYCRDFGISPKPEDCIQFVIRKSRNKLDFRGALLYIYQKLVVENDKYNDILTIPESKKKEKNLNLKVYIDDKYRKDEISYWLDVIPWLNKQKLVSIYKVYRGELYINGNLSTFKSLTYKPVFCYMFDQKRQIFKFYSPKEKLKEKKFFANNVAGHIQGIHLIETLYKNPAYTGLYIYDDLIIITKSYKDAITISELGFHAVAVHAESVEISDDFIYYLLEKGYKRIILLYDNDKTGLERGEERAIEKGLDYMYYPLVINDKPVKDTWDMLIAFNSVRHLAQNYLRNLINSI